NGSARGRNEPAIGRFRPPSCATAANRAHFVAARRLLYDGPEEGDMRPARIAILLGLICGGCGGDGGGTGGDGGSGGTGGGGGVTCGNGICESGESAATCCTDCGCSGGRVCQGGACVASSPPDMAGSCVQSSDSCTQNGDCCSYIAHTGYCVNFGSG